MCAQRSLDENSTAATGHLRSMAQKPDDVLHAVSVALAFPHLAGGASQVAAAPVAIAKLHAARHCFAQRDE